MRSGRQSGSCANTDDHTLNVLPSLCNRLQKQQTEESALFFTEEEIKKMPKTFRKEFRVDGCTSHIRQRKSGKKTVTYEIRYRRNGYNVTVTNKDLKVAKEKFIEALHVAVKNEPSKKVPNVFDEFALYYFNNFHKRKVAAETYRIALNQFNNHILPAFGKSPLKRITPKQCQDLLDKLSDIGRYKTAEDIFTLLNKIFKAAIKHNLLINNPMDMVFHEKHEREHGKALTKEEEKILLEATAGTPFQLMFAVALYTGMRPNEYATAQLKGKFIIAVNSKRKNGKIEYKKIPVTPMLEPYLLGVTKLQFESPEIIRRRFNKILPNHKLYDLRTTFYTRCQECGVAPVARDEFVGHSLGALGNTYTDLSEDYLYAEGLKLKY